MAEIERERVMSFRSMNRVTSYAVLWLVGSLLDTLVPDKP